MMANKKFEREAAFRNRLAILVALVFHLLLLGAVVFKADIQRIVEGKTTATELDLSPRP